MALSEDVRQLVPGLERLTDDQFAWVERLVKAMAVPVNARRDPGSDLFPDDRSLGLFFLYLLFLSKNFSLRLPCRLYLCLHILFLYFYHYLYCHLLKTIFFWFAHLDLLLLHPHPLYLPKDWTLL